VLIQFHAPARLIFETSSAAALELAIVLPLMLLLLAGVYDLSEAVIIRAEIYNAAQVMAASASALAVQADGSTALTYDQIQQVESSIWALVPSLRSGQGNGAPASITMSSVLFYPTFNANCVWGQKTPCSYAADVAWSVAYTGGDSGQNFAYNLPTAGCNSYFTDPGQSQVSATANLAGTDNVAFYRSLALATSGATFADTGTEENEAGISPILVVNIQYTYRPVFNLFLKNLFTFWVDGYWPVRSVKTMAAVGPNTVNGHTVTVEPLSSQFTTINGASLSGADVVKGAWCVDPTISNPSATS